MAAISAVQPTSPSSSQEAVLEAIPKLLDGKAAFFKEVPSDKTESFYNSTTAVAISADEYDAILTDQKLPFSGLIDKHGIEKLLSVLSVETLKQKFEAEFDELPDAEILRGLDLLKFAKLNQHGIISDETMNQIKKAFRWSDLCPLYMPRYSKQALIAIFGLKDLVAKFESQFGRPEGEPIEFTLQSALACEISQDGCKLDAKTLRTLDLLVFDKLHKHGMISDELMGRIKDAFKYSDLNDETKKLFTSDELDAKFIAECGALPSLTFGNPPYREFPSHDEAVEDFWRLNDAVFTAKWPGVSDESQEAAPAAAVVASETNETKLG